MPEPSLYERLAAPFDKTFTREIGGQVFTYLTKEQVYSRANEVLGFTWGYDVQQASVNPEADEAVVRVRVTVLDPTTGTPMHREGFGSSKVKRKRSTGEVMDLGNDFKAATSDAVKNALASFGIGLYLYEKDGGSVPNAGARTARSARSEDAPASGGIQDEAGAACDDCGNALQPLTFKAKPGQSKGDTWSVSRLVEYGQKKHGRTLCKDHVFSGGSRSSSSSDLPF